MKEKSSPVSWRGCSSLGEDFFNENMDWVSAAALENLPVVVKEY